MRPGQRECELCGSTILRLFTTGGILLDLDPDPTDDGNRQIITVDGVIRALTLTGHDLPAPPGTAHTAHQCPAKAPSGIPCANPRCRIPMPREIATRLNWSYHPACEPEHTDQLLDEHRARVRAQFKPRKRKRAR